MKVLFTENNNNIEINRKLTTIRKQLYTFEYVNWLIYFIAN